MKTKLTKRRKARTPANSIFQKHHLLYGPPKDEGPEETVIISKIEHITYHRLQSTWGAVGISPDMRKALVHLMAKYKDRTDVVYKGKL